jgi:hypothetical protein
LSLDQKEALYFKSLSRHHSPSEISRPSRNTEMLRNRAISTKPSYSLQVVLGSMAPRHKMDLLYNSPEFASLSDIRLSARQERPHCFKRSPNYWDSPISFKSVGSRVGNKNVGDFGSSLMDEACRSAYAGQTAIHLECVPFSHFRTILQQNILPARVSFPWAIRA